MEITSSLFGIRVRTEVLSMDLKDWPDGTPPELVEMWGDSYRRAKTAGKEALDGWKAGTWGMAGRVEELCGVVAERRVSRPVAFDTGIAALNALLGSGFPTGITEVFGASSVGKSSLVYQLIGAAQVSGLRAVLCSTQRPPEPLMVRCGVDTESLCLLRAPCLELAASVLLEEFVAREGRLFLVVDTATALRPLIDERGCWAEVMEIFLSHLANGLSPCSAAVIVNEVRARRSVDPSRTFAGGTDSAAKRVASLFPTRLELARDEVGEEEYTLVVHAVSNQNRPPRQYVTLPTRKGYGVDAVRSLVEIAVSMGEVEKKGNHLYFGGQPLGQGVKAASRFLHSDKQEQVLDQLYVRVQELISGVG